MNNSSREESAFVLSELVSVCTPADAYAVIVSCYGLYCK